MGRKLVFGELEKLRVELSNIKYELHDEIRSGKSTLRFPNVRTKDETIEMLQNEQLSIARFGDGEFRIALGESIPFQAHSKELEGRLRDVLATKSSHLLVGIPAIYGTLEDLKPRHRMFWRHHLAGYRSAIYDLLDFERIYVDAFFSRPYIMFQNPVGSANYFQRVRHLWSGKDVVLIEGDMSRVGVGNDILSSAASVQRILGPARGAFSRYEDLLKEAERSARGREAVFLLALGPTATVLAHDLSAMGYRALDIGHIDLEYEWFKRGASEKILIPGKYVNEVAGGDQVEDVKKNGAYQSQIIANFS